MLLSLSSQWFLSCGYKCAHRGGCKHQAVSGVWQGDHDTETQPTGISGCMVYFKGIIGS